MSLLLKKSMQLQKRLLKYLEQGGKLEEVVRSTQIPEAFLRQFRDGKKILTAEELEQLEQYLTEQSDNQKRLRDLMWRSGNRLTAKEVTERTGIATESLGLFFGGIPSLSQADQEKLLEFLEREKVVDEQRKQDADKQVSPNSYLGVRLIRRLLETPATAIDETKLGLDDLEKDILGDFITGNASLPAATANKLLAYFKMGMLSNDWEKLTRVNEINTLEASLAEKVQEKLARVNEINTFEIAEKLDLNVSALRNYLNGDSELSAEGMKKLLEYFESMRKEKKMEENKLIDEETLRKIRDLLQEKVGGDFQAIKAFQHVSKLADWADKLGLHVEITKEATWKLSFPHPKTKVYEEIYESTSLRDLTLLLFTVSLTQESFGLGMEKNKEENDLVVPRMLEY